MTNALYLESFDSEALSPENEDAGASNEYDSGFQAGMLAAETKFSNQQSGLREDIVQALSDINFTFAEAHAHVIGQLEPLFRIAITSLFPSLANQSFLMTLQHRLIDAAKVDSSAAITLSVHPNQFSAIEALTNTLPASNVSLKSDPTLTPLCALISADALETVFDLDAALFELQETIAIAISA